MNGDEAAKKSRLALHDFTSARQDCRAFPCQLIEPSSGFAFGVAVMPVVSLLTPG